jgi:sigma-54 dependent transcriptional regulator, acetoin dehydrogenase operon transcriptional activator AcoR
MAYPQHSPSGVPTRRNAEADRRPIADSLRLSPFHVEVIEQSHARCAALGVSRIERPDFSAGGPGDLAMARERTRRLLDRAAPVMEMLHDQIVDSHSMVVLTDSAGLIVHTIGDNDFLERADKVALRPGVDWSEASKGTNAVGTALMQETPTLVHADEHYLHANQFLTCSAAPILDPRGNILGVLDVSGDHRGYHQHTMALVKMSARMIENQWLSDDHRNVMRLHFHSKVQCIGTLMEGLLAVGADGRIVGANRGALEQLGLNGAALRANTLDSLFGVPIAALVDRFRSPLTTPMPVHTADGRSFHILARFEWPVWSNIAEAVSVPPLPATAAPARAQAQPGARSRPSALEQLRHGDPQVDQLLDKVAQVIDRGINLLIVGEAGSGKTHLARAIHASSARADQPFVALRCAGMAEALLEAELLGREEPAAGRARRNGSVGRVVQASGGTLYLADVGELSPALQGQLLRILREREVYPVGSVKPVAVDVHIVCSSRRNLLELVELGRFDEDLYYRLNGLRVQLPALRQRTDLLSLAHSLLLRDNGASPPSLSAEVRDLLCAYPWPGNVRELGNVLRTASAIAGSRREITTDCLAEEVLCASAAQQAAELPAPLAEPPASSLEALEIELIRRAVEAAGGNISAAAKQLGISRNKVYRKLRWT